MMEGIHISQEIFAIGMLRALNPLQNMIASMCDCYDYMETMLKDDRTVSLSHQEFPQTLVLCLPKKNWGHWENLGESWDQTFEGSDREKCQF